MIIDFGLPKKCMILSSVNNPQNKKDMKKIKKVTRRAFTEKQLDMLEQYHYLYKKIWRIGLSDDESEYYDSLAEKIRKFIVIY